ncbi:DNA polymerase III subunit beta [Paenibacillus melissococcoides]|uniref:DNA polymerase III subunit beta n=1 Tax=Paenibacillus melissococcoides TaxID=2912268 RepID=A0ABM9GE11_9BACL|nr:MULTISPECIES: DNA polymerase III subunit beta [Paenibacillus]MEB9895708.1 DNA polymerase III subunit beta [Bacillus cereus]GIO81549.1 DNA polymerase III subunit beta [Paenibacillus dendritiformis]CAH8249496.1 DNA polymerase III subunit beta [Paenibacillus melissococcoides]CAH8721195.1 DNA polymerase III subunit beta [Paenibacillus melissococcoides]
MSALLDEYQYDHEVIETKEMSFHVEHEGLMLGLKLCEKIVPRSGTIPILQCIKFDLNGDTLFITAMDTGQSILHMLKVENEGKVNGSYLFPAKEGIELVKQLPRGRLTLTKKESTILFNYGKRGKANLRVLNPEEYPELPKMESTDIITVPADVLRKAAQAAGFSSTDKGTPSLTGIHVFNHNGKLAFEGTDRHRIYRYVSDVCIVNQETFKDVIVPAENFKHITKDIVESLKSEQIELAITSSYLILRNNHTVYFAGLTDGTFPELSNIFTLINKGKAVTLSRWELNDTLNRALSFDVSNNRVTLERNEEGEFILHTQSENGELSEGFTNVDMEQEFPISKLNGRYLRDALLVLDRDVNNVTFRNSGDLMPCVLTADSDPSVVIIVNQVR